MFLLDMTVGEVATQLPGASAVFFRHKINFCCKGNETLKALLNSNDKAAEIIAELEDIQQRGITTPNWNEMSEAELVEHLMRRYHQVHREQLPELIRLAARVEAVHGEHDKCPNGLARHLKLMQEELEQHMQKEEHILFPMLCNNYGATAAGPISVMREEHDEHFQAIEKIYKLTNDITLHPEACNTWQALYLGLQAFIADINMHIHIENDVLFERAVASKPHDGMSVCCGSCGGA